MLGDILEVSVYLGLGFLGVRLTVVAWAKWEGWKIARRIDAECSNCPRNPQGGVDCWRCYDIGRSGNSPSGDNGRGGARGDFRRAGAHCLPDLQGAS